MNPASTDQAQRCNVSSQWQPKLWYSNPCQPQSQTGSIILPLLGRSQWPGLPTPRADQLKNTHNFWGSCLKLGCSFPPTPAALTMPAGTTIPSIPQLQLRPAAHSGLLSRAGTSATTKPGKQLGRAGATALPEQWGVLERKPAPPSSWASHFPSALDGCRHPKDAIQWGQLLPGQRHGPAAMAATLASQEAWLPANRAASMGGEAVEFGSVQNEGLEAGFAVSTALPAAIQRL